MRSRWDLLFFLLFLSSPLKSLHAADLTVVHFKDGRTASGQLVFCTDNLVKLKSVESGKEVTYPILKIDWVEFAPLSGESEALASPESATAESLADLWEERRKNLKIPRNPAAEIGMLLASRLEGSGKPGLAIPIYSLIEKDAWMSSCRREAMLARLGAMLKTDQAKEAVAEAELRITEAGDDKLQTQRFRFILLESGAQQLEALRKENPLWEEDDYVRPVRDRLYHETLDGFLNAYLFHGASNEVAARGLWGATQVYVGAGELAKAKHCARDIQLLYSDTSFAKRASAFLNSLPKNGTPAQRDEAER